MKKSTHFIPTLLFALFVSSFVFAQTKDAKADIFSSAERDSLQLWFYDRATVMGLKDEKRDEFYNIVLYHSYKMRALEKKDKGYTPEEVRKKFEELLAKQHKEVGALLSEKQYAYYLDTYEKILKDVYDRKGWK